VLVIAVELCSLTFQTGDASRRALFCGVAATSAPCSSNQCFSHATEENSLSARKASWPSEVSRNPPMGRSSKLASASPKAAISPSGVTESATLKP
jgi:hypothetical protein